MWGDKDPFTPLDGPYGKYFQGLCESEEVRMRRWMRMGMGMRMRCWVCVCESEEVRVRGWMRMRLCVFV